MDHENTLNLQSRVPDLKTTGWAGLDGARILRLLGGPGEHPGPWIGLPDGPGGHSESVRVLDLETTIGNQVNILNLLGSRILRLPGVPGEHSDSLRVPDLKTTGRAR